MVYTGVKSSAELKNETTACVPESVILERLVMRTGWLALVAGTVWEGLIVLFGLADPIYLLAIAVQAVPAALATVWIRFLPGRPYNRYIVTLTGVLVVSSIHYGLEDVSMFYMFLLLQAIALIYQDRVLVWVVTLESIAAFTFMLALRPEYLEVIAQFTGELWNGLSSIYFSFILAAMFYTTVGHVLIANVKRLQSERLNRERMITKQLAEGLSSALEARDTYTAGHSKRVAEYAAIIAAHLPGRPLPDHELRVACLLHDIGKIGISDQLLRKRGHFTPDEWQQVRRHVDIGHQILRNVSTDYPIAEWVRCHHERLDGSGYPRALTGERIPLASRVIAVADALDAMTTDRPYRSGLSLEEVQEELEKLTGKQFDPDVVTAFQAALPEIEGALEEHKAQARVRHIRPAT